MLSLFRCAHVVIPDIKGLYLGIAFLPRSKNQHCVVIRRLEATNCLPEVIRNEHPKGNEVCRIAISSNETQGKQLIKGIHEPLVSEQLFDEVQSIINSKRKFASKIKESNDMFILRKYLICPACKGNLTASFSRGRRNKKYPYYHCRSSCKTRFKAEIINQNYEDQLKKFRLFSEAVQLFNLILEDINLSTTRETYLKERKLLQKQIGDQEFYISKARKFFVIGNIEYQDFYEMKKEYQGVSDDLKDELAKNNTKLNCIEKQYNRADKSHKNIFASFGDLDVSDKKTIIDQVPPYTLDINGAVSLKISGALSKILIAKINYVIH